MGSSDNDKDANADEKPQHTVYLDGYYIYKTDVTVGEYKAFCAATGMAMPEMPRWGWIDSHPMVNVSWGEACAYAKWAGAHLPSEAQWEKAARGTDGRKYSWGMHWDAKKCNNSSNHLYSTSAVGKYAKDVSPYGCLDMAGNVMQWCDDWYGENFYKISPTRNPKGPESGERRSLRGGSWDDKIPDDFRCASRSFNDSVKHQPERCDNIGFRCVVDPSQ